MSKYTTIRLDEIMECSKEKLILILVETLQLLKDKDKEIDNFKAIIEDLTLENYNYEDTDFSITN